MSTVTHPRNPFARGFSDLRNERLLCILYDAPAPRSYLPPHPSQQRSSDQQLERFHCLFNDTAVQIVTLDETWTAHADNHPHPGIVVQVI